MRHSRDVERSGGGRTRAGDVYADLRHKVMAGVLAPGARLSPAALAAEYNVSATVVREALTRLAGEQLAHSSPQQGFSVATATDAELIDLMKVRTLIDSEGLRLSVEQADLAWKGALVSAHYMLSHTSAGNEGPAGLAATQFGDVHQKFHAALVSGCGSPRLIAISQRLYDETEIYRRYLRHLYPGTLDRASKEHDSLVEAALAGKAEEAVAILVKHFEGTTRDLLNSAVLQRSRLAAGPDMAETSAGDGRSKQAGKPRAARAPRSKAVSARSAGRGSR